MGNAFRKNKKDIKIVNVITKSCLLKYPHLNSATVRVWPNDFNASSMCPAESDISFSEIIVNSNSF